MIFIRTCIIDGKYYARDIDVSQEAFLSFLNTPTFARPYVQHAFPNLGKDDREFILTGMTPELWDEISRNADDVSGDFNE